MKDIAIPAVIIFAFIAVAGWASNKSIEQKRECMERGGNLVYRGECGTFRPLEERK